MINSDTMTTDQQIEIAIRCAKLVYKEPKWNKWADDWLDGSNRSDVCAIACVADVKLAVWAAVDAAHDVALSLRAIASAARATADAAWAAYAAADAVANPTDAALAVTFAIRVDPTIDLSAIYERVCGNGRQEDEIRNSYRNNSRENTSALES